MTNLSFKSPKIFKGLASFGLAVLLMSSPTYGAKTPNIHFYPEQPWTIDSPRTDAQSNGQCRIHNEFNNGFIMSFSGTRAWVQDMQINFRQDVFEAGKSFEALLRVPGIAEESFSANAKTGRLLNISLQGQKDFYKSLRDSSVLDLTLAGNHFRFYLTGFSKTAEDFERCLAGLDSTNAPVAVLRDVEARDITIEQKAPSVSAPPIKQEEEIVVAPPTPDAQEPEKTVVSVQKDGTQSYPRRRRPQIKDVPVAVVPAPPPLQAIESVAIETDEPVAAAQESVASVAPPPLAVPAPEETGIVLPKPEPSAPSRAISTPQEIAASLLQENLVKPPQQDFLLNESIAYEQSEITGVPITEIIPPRGDAEIDGIPAQRARDIGAPTSNAGDEANGNSGPLKRPEPRVRLTEKLAQDLLDNPNLAWSGDPNDPRKSYIGSTRKPLELPPSLAEQPEAQSAAKVAPVQKIAPAEPAAAQATAKYNEAQAEIKRLKAKLAAKEKAAQAAAKAKKEAAAQVKRRAVTPAPVPAKPPAPKKAVETIIQKESKAIAAPPSPVQVAPQTIKTPKIKTVEVNANDDYEDELLQLQKNLEAQRRQMDALEAQLGE